MNVPCSLTPAGPLCSATAALGIVFRHLDDVDSHDYQTFRGSITRPAHSLSTLRRVGYPTATQDSLPAAGQPYRAGLVTRRVPTKGFRSSPPPFPSFAWRTQTVCQTASSSSVLSPKGFPPRRNGRFCLALKKHLKPALCRPNF
jgi:hypothetical protein